MLAKEIVANEDHAGTAVGHLTAVESSDPALHGWVDRVVATGGDQIRYLPVAGLGVGIAAGVGEVEGGDRVQVGVVDAESAVVFFGDLGEHRRP